MRFFEWFSRVPTDTAAVPEVVMAGYETALLDTLAEEGLRPINCRVTTNDSSIADLFVHIEYTLSDGSVSKRPITIKNEVINEGKVSLVAMCNQSRGMKWFRLDRITAIYAADGRVYRPASEFWDLIGYKPKKVNAETASPKTVKTASDVKEEHKHQLRVLGALAGADGHLHIKEVDSIVAFLESEVVADGASTDANVHAGLSEVIKRMRITREALDESLDYLFGGDGHSRLEQAELARFLEAARKVVDADGLFHKAEFEFLDYLETEYLEDHWDLIQGTEPGTRID